MSIGNPFVGTATEFANFTDLYYVNQGEGDNENAHREVEGLTDSRRQWENLRHKLVDIVSIGLVSVICGELILNIYGDAGHGRYE